MKLYQRGQEKANFFKIFVYTLASRHRYLINFLKWQCDWLINYIQKIDTWDKDYSDQYHESSWTIFLLIRFCQFKLSQQGLMRRLIFNTIKKVVPPPPFYFFVPPNFFIKQGF